MSKCLVVILGHCYIQPMNLVADIEVLIENHCKQSCNNIYLYNIFSFNDNLNAYLMRGYVYKGEYYTGNNPNIAVSD